MARLDRAQQLYKEGSRQSQETSPFWLRVRYRRLRRQLSGQPNDVMIGAQLAAVRDEFARRDLELPPCRTNTNHS